MSMKADGKQELTPHSQTTYWEAVYKLHKAGMTTVNTASVLAMCFGRETAQCLRDLEKGTP